MQAVRAAVLKRMQVGVAASWVQGPAFAYGFRLFSTEAHGTYLDKHVVTDRVLNVVKKMQKVDTAKVSSRLQSLNFFQMRWYILKSAKLWYAFHCKKMKFCNSHGINFLRVANSIFMPLQPKFILSCLLVDSYI